MQSETRLDKSLKTMEQTISRHQQTWRFKPHSCKSWERGWNIPSYYNRDSNSTKEQSPDLLLKMQINQKWICIFNLLKTQQCYIKLKINHPSISTDRAIGWYHHCLQHPSHSRLEETMRSVIYWKGIDNPIWSWVKSYRSCQKQETRPKVWSCTSTKLVVMTPYSALCVDKIRQYALNGKDNTQVNFMCLTMIDLWQLNLILPENWI